ncbi:prolyl oligopeptidase family serine peptidase [Microvirga sp. STS02]|uniref:S9 family peptidase n=1 Tax=Hymenobacter negativus TaxID=2795026 RepID=UPI0018DDF366|nr:MULTISPECIES: S9 family peptidase [Bacteria]MBH8567972.1 prolyl oligopeptidase family serine peptidase [Hymenobacter negativus]MBR7207708.1 prolyl oligopeptidase family serine peptidase [Microvirga sp. STS02]
MKNFFLGLGLVLSLAAPQTGFAQAAKSGAQPPLIDRELLFGDPEISGAQLSPDGRFLSFIKPYNGTRNIWVKGLNEAFDQARPMTNDQARPVRSYFWSRDGKYLLYSQDKGGDENFNIYAVNPTEAPAAGQPVPTARDLTGLKGVRVQLLNAPLSDPNTLYIGLNDRDKAWHDLYKLNLTTGEKTLVRQNNDRIGAWEFDWNDQLRLASRSNPDGSTEWLRVEGDKLVPFYKTSIDEQSGVIAFAKDNQHVYMATNRGAGRNLAEIVLLDPATGQEQPYQADPMKRVDVGSLQVSEKTHEPVYVSFEDDRMRRVWKDKAMEQDFAVVTKQLPGLDVYPASHTTDERLWLLSATSATQPSVAYLFDRQTKKLTKQYETRPKLRAADLADMKVVRYKSSDGLEIPAYLTLPKGLAAKNLPVIILPHGGPWARDAYGFNTMHQFLANRGYAVLSPNFRASTGYGKQFLNAGNGEWGRKMQDDLTWGVKYLVAQGIADPKRVGIMGGSYGGYATLAGVAFTPDVYNAAVAIVAPSNLTTLLNAIPPYWEAGRKQMYARMADPGTPEGRAALDRMSPLGSADKIKTPLMVVQGANDPRVNKAEADQIVVALRDRNYPVQYLCAPDEGHGFARPVNNMAMFAASEKFLASQLKGRYQESMSPAVAKRLQEITVDPKTVQLATQTNVK